MVLACVAYIRPPELLPTEKYVWLPPGKRVAAERPGIFFLSHPSTGDVEAEALEGQMRTWG